ncbi:unnamed protein product [Caenorhabditis auriculariae]|uniref:Sulfur globule protein CV3 domain protein n=1 Tax=Caenorhabditis auriculariae TaxID=2777116 RepID=A0A8S1GVV7_9PELO|nr:unnamed protein product [Caenorhabditis auriculariae]
MKIFFAITFCVLLVVSLASANDGNQEHERPKRQWGYGMGYGMGMYRPWGMYGMYGMYRPWGMMPFMMGR